MPGPVLVVGDVVLGGVVAVPLAPVVAVGCDGEVGPVVGAVTESVQLSDSALISETKHFTEIADPQSPSAVRTMLLF
jgi:hypothetical protein